MARLSRKRFTTPLITFNSQVAEVPSSNIRLGFGAFLELGAWKLELRNQRLLTCLLRRESNLSTSPSPTSPLAPARLVCRSPSAFAIPGRPHPFCSRAFGPRRAAAPLRQF